MHLSNCSFFYNEAVLVTQWLSGNKNGPFYLMAIPWLSHGLLQLRGGFFMLFLFLGLRRL